MFWMGHSKKHLTIAFMRSQVFTIKVISVLSLVVHRIADRQ